MTGSVRGASLVGREYGGVGLTVDIGGLVRRVIDEIWNRQELALADMVFTPGYVNHGGLIPDLIRGPEVIKFTVALYRRAFPEFHIAVDGVTKEVDAIVIRWVAHSRRTLMRGRVDREGVSGA
jgi:SnoaL-like polyketide cyclase